MHSSSSNGPARAACTRTDQDTGRRNDLRGDCFLADLVAGMEGVHRAPRREPGSGVLLGLEETDGSLTGLEAELKQLADANKIPFGYRLFPEHHSSEYLPMPALPAKWAHIGIATAWQDTPAETIDSHDLNDLVELLHHLCRRAHRLKPGPLAAEIRQPSRAGCRITDRPRRNCDLETACGNIWRERTRRPSPR